MVANLGSDVSADAKVRALEEVLGSETFSRSERLKSMLRFICEAEIEGREQDLNEYSIGTMALGRPQDFAPLEDSSVRSRAHELRQKLEKYYAHEAPASSVRIELRKGTYVPRFCPVREEHEIAVPAAASASPLEVVPPIPGRRPLAIAAIAFALGAAAMFGAISLWSAVTRPGVRVPATHLETAGKVWTPELETLWRPFTNSGIPLLIAFETRYFVRLGPLMVRDWHVNSPDNIKDSEALMQVQRLFDFRRNGNRDYTDGGTPSALFNLTRLLSTRIPAMSLKNSLDVTAADFRDNNIILLGKPGMDPAIERTLARGELVDAGGKILNIRPRPGEQSEYLDESDPTNPDRWGKKYSVITMMPGSSSGKRILTLTASGSEQPAALAYYMTNPDTVRELVERMRSEGAKAPDFFQVLVRAEYKTKGVVKVDYITHRILKVQ